ncbi:hypothetical protein OG874_13580 [Nocardia sp. NBC_00565]|uniref:hypothetical protein n=1 Tax=Nocardia sp. NBC_00565 TaxID=2975993 RepID=UPI002E80ADAA|nr:hypothetical protein [Nocardia sp. NBC_00565]WUC06099.1 hypothetical protein OG874_13580 [Nocardia sp. NBC_00565]
MRGVGSRWHSFEYTLVAAGPCAVAVDPWAVGVAQTFFDCLVVRVIVEPGDYPLTDEAVRAIRYLCLVSEAAYIVIAGTPHCATPGSRFTPASNPFDVLTHVADTLDVLSDLAEQLEKYGERVHLMPFGWSVAWRAEKSARRWDLPSITVSASGNVHVAPDSVGIGHRARACPVR